MYIIANLSFTTCLFHVQNFTPKFGVRSLEILVFLLFFKKKTQNKQKKNTSNKSFLLVLFMLPKD